MVSVTVVSASQKPSKRFPATVDVPGSLSTVTVGDLKKAIAAKFPSLYVDRQKLSLKGQKNALQDEATLTDAGVVDGGEVVLKDLGPQISWRTVFLIEYAGPLVIHPLIYHFPKIFYGGPVHHSLLQRYIYAFVMLHFLKRELETLFVHRFSHSTMPFRNVFKNSGHYHILSGIFLAWAIYRPALSATAPYVVNTIRENPLFLWTGTAVWLFAELSNLIVHIKLRNLRPAGTRTRAIPYGYGFSLVSCPNYFFEALAWLVVAVLSNSWAAWLFLVVSTGQMALWAVKKHKNYKKEFGKEYPRNRKAMVPFIY